MEASLAEAPIIMSDIGKEVELFVLNYLDLKNKSE